MNRDLNDYPEDVRPLLFVLFAFEEYLSEGYGRFVPNCYNRIEHATQELSLTRIARDMAVLYWQREEKRLHAAGLLTRDELQEEARQLRLRMAELLDLALDGEWMPYGGGTDLRVCPECDEFESDGHDADCWKGAVIAKAKGASDDD